MAGWLSKILARIRRLAVARRVELTRKAVEELAALPVELNLDDVCEVLAGLTAEESAGRLQSRRTGEWMYVFKPVVAGLVVYLKVVVLEDCVVISFHEDEGQEN